MGTPTPHELALQAEVRQLRERIAELEQGRQSDARLMGEGDLQSLAGIQVPAQQSNARQGNKEGRGRKVIEMKSKSRAVRPKHGTRGSRRR